MSEGIQKEGGWEREIGRWKIQPATNAFFVNILGLVRCSLFLRSFGWAYCTVLYWLVKKWSHLCCFKFC